MLPNMGDQEARLNAYCETAATHPNTPLETIVLGSFQKAHTTTNNKERHLKHSPY